METSLIGKAVGFGPKEYGFEPHVSNIQYDNYAYVMNHYNLAASKKIGFFKIPYTKKTIVFIKLLKEIGAVTTFTIIKPNSNSFKTYLLVTINYFKDEAFFKHIKLISTPSRSCHIKFSTLTTLKKMYGMSIIVLQTPYGLVTSEYALKKRIGGKLFAILT